MSESVGRKAAKAGVGYTIGNILVRGVTFLSLPVFTRLMSTQEFGLYTTYVSYVNILTLLSGLGLHASFKAAKAEFSKEIDEYTSAMLTITLVYNILLLAVAFLLRQQIGVLLTFDSWVIMLMFVQALASAIFSMYNSRIGLEYSYKRYLLLSAVNSISNVVLSVVFILTINKDNPFLGRVLGTVVALLMVAVVPMIIFYKKSGPLLKKKYLVFGLTYSIPLIPHGLSQIILAQFGKIIIQRQVGNREAGIYGFAYSIAAIPQIMVTSLEAAWGPWFFDTYKAGRISEIKKRSTEYVALFAALTGVLFCMSPEVVMLMAREEYWSAGQLIAPAILGVFFTFLYTLPAQVEYYFKKTKYIAFGTMLAAVLNVVLCLYFVPRLGYECAVYVTVVTYVIYFVLHMLIATHLTKDKLPFEVKTIAGYALAVCMLCVLVQFCLQQWMIRYVLAVAWCIIFVLLNKETVINILKRDK